MSNNKTCKVCGEKYYYCFNQTCTENQPSYMALFHDENCKVIFETLNKLYFNQITEKKAVKTLKRCDLSVLDFVSADNKIKSKVYELLDNHTVTQQAVEPALESVNEQVETLNAVEEVFEAISEVIPVYTGV